MKTALIIYQNDQLANTVRAEKISHALQERGLHVQLLDAKKYFDVYLDFDLEPGKKWRKFLYYKLHRLHFFLQFFYREKKLPLPASLERRGQALSLATQVQKAQIIICQSNSDMAVLLHLRKDQIAIFDTPTPYSFELEYGPTLIPPSELRQLRKLEEAVYKTANLVTFNWPTYRQFVEQHQHFRFHNYLQGSSGCEQVEQIAQFRKKPKVVFVGNLDDYWANSEELIQLVNSSPFVIDLYGATQNTDIKKMPQYRGYISAATQKVLAQYQFGLITLSKDPLRKQGFSAKHLLYLSYGLPVLCPRWRRDQILGPATIAYDPRSFVNDLTPYLKQKNWDQKHQHAVRLARQLSWDRTLAAFADKIAALAQEDV